MFYLILSVAIIGATIIYKVRTSDSDPSISQIEKAYKNHKRLGPIPFGKPVMYQKGEYYALYHKKMIEFYDEMMIIENDGYNPLTLSLD
jgi:hypothetical protein